MLHIKDSYSIAVMHSCANKPNILKIRVPFSCQWVKSKTTYSGVRQNILSQAHKPHAFSRARALASGTSSGELYGADICILL